MHRAMPSHRCFTATFLLVCATAAPAAAPADEMDEILGGFEDELEPAGPSSEAAPVADRWWDLTGSISVGSSINYLKHDAVAGVGRTTDYGGLSRLRTRLNLQLDLDLPFDWDMRVAGFGFYDWSYLMNGRDDYTEEVLDQYEWEVDFQEVWIQGSPYNDLDLKIGRQIVNWGRSDNLRVLDVLNPLDNREPGLVDIEDLRRPVTMVKSDYYLGRWSFQAIAIPEIRFDELPPLGNDFAPVTSSLGTVGLFVFPKRKPGVSLANTEWAARVNGIFSGWDVSFHYARYWRDLEYLRPVVTIGPPPMPGELPTVSFEGSELLHSRLHLVGAGANYTFGSWLLKSEIAWNEGIHYTTSTTVDLAPFGGVGTVDVPTGVVRKSRLDFMAGIEYYGFTNTNIAVEVANRHIFGFRDDMRPLFGTQENALETAIRVSRSLLRERLELTAVALVFGTYAQDGSVVRLDWQYDVTDGLEFNGGIVFYQKGDPIPFDSIWRNDRIFLEVKHSF